MSLYFSRRGDEVGHEFRREADSASGHPSYRRVDAELFCRWLPGFGWCVIDSTPTVLSRPFDDPGVGELPPEGAWVSRKGDRSFVYDLRHLPD